MQKAHARVDQRESALGETVHAGGYGTDATNVGCVSSTLTVGANLYPGLWIRQRASEACMLPFESASGCHFMPVKLCQWSASLVRMMTRRTSSDWHQLRPPSIDSDAFAL